jgi:riboflavin kinase / FMN adenylyltransferase
VSAAVAVGVFDGLHLGHAEILGRAVALARARGGRAVVVSFDPHPDVVLARTFNPVAPLTPFDEKRERMRALGVDELEVLPFTRELASLEPEAFVERHLVRPFGLHSLVVGENFALGRGRSGNLARLRAIGGREGFEVEAVPLLEREGGPVTSTRIRGLLAEGRVREAARLFGRRYGLGGLVVAGEAIGRTLGVPTANLRLHEEKFIPRHGIYAVWGRIAGETAWRPGAMSIGVRPTFGGQVPALEVHLLDWDGDLRGRDLEVEFEDWIREQIRFESPAALAVAMQGDLVETRRRLGSAPAPTAESAPSRPAGG